LTFPERKGNTFALNCLEQGEKALLCLKVSNLRKRGTNIVPVVRRGKKKRSGGGKSRPYPASAIQGKRFFHKAAKKSRGKKDQGGREKSGPCENAKRSKF